MNTHFVGFLLLLMLMSSFQLYSNAQEATPEATPQADSIVIPEGWRLVWHDEFDDEFINPDYWTYDLGAGGWGNGEAQYYTDRPRNARLEDGFLVIELIRSATKVLTIHLPVSRPRACRNSSTGASKPA